MTPTMFLPPVGIVRLWDLPDHHLELLISQRPDKPGFFEVGISNTSTHNAIHTPDSIRAESVINLLCDTLPGVLVSAIMEAPFIDMSEEDMAAKIVLLDADIAASENPVRH